MDIHRLVIVDPSGNPTALVFDPIPPAMTRKAGQLIQDEYPSVEQVVFVQKRGGMPHAQLAGGEFCANAARAVGYVLSGGMVTEQRVTVSGASAPMTIHTSRNRAKLDLHMCMREECRVLGETPVPVLHLEGISFGILMPQNPRFDILRYGNSFDEIRVRSAMKELGLMSFLCCGLLFVEDLGQDKVKLTPFVYIRDIETFFAETACASGSIAAATFLGRNLSILQPSGKYLDVEVNRKENRLAASVDGEIIIKWDGPALKLGTAWSQFSERRADAIAG
ncbi:MAG: hypothetical protein PHW76_08850 [Alphaproteobacteria bacterium]|nr:hypothetical protein [Alphaproteobacteria bacterium]